MSIWILIMIYGAWGCSEEQNKFPLLSDVGERPVSPVYQEMQNDIIALEQDRLLLVEKNQL